MRKSTLLMSLFLPLLGVTEAKAQLAPVEVTPGKTVVLKSLSENYNHYFMTTGNKSRVFNPDQCVYTVEAATFGDPAASEDSRNRPYFKLKNGSNYIKGGNTSGNIQTTSSADEAAVFYAQEITGGGSAIDKITIGDLISGVETSKLTRFVRADATGTFLNCGQEHLQWAGGKGGYSAFYVYERSDVDGIINAHVYTEKSNLIPPAVSSSEAANATAYFIQNTPSGKFLNSIRAASKNPAVAGQFVFVTSEKSHVYKIYNKTTGKYLKWTSKEEGADKQEEVDDSSDEALLWWIRPDESDTEGVVDILPYGEFKQGWNWHGGPSTTNSMGLYQYTDPQSKWRWTEARSLDEYLPWPVSSASQGAKTYYTIKNCRVNKYANYDGQAASHILENANLSMGSYWYFAEATDVADVPAGYKAYRIYNAAKALPVKNPETNLFEDQVYYIEKFATDEHCGYTISRSTNADVQQAWNDKSESSVCNYSAHDPGSIWTIDSSDMTESALQTQAQQVKTDALDYVSVYENCGTTYYSYADEQLAEARSTFENSNVEDGELHEKLSVAFDVRDALSALQQTKTGAPVAGDYIRLVNKQYHTYLTAGEERMSGTGDARNLNTLWLVEASGDEGYFKLKNAGTGKYVGTIVTSNTTSLTDEASAAALAWTNPADFYAAFRNSTAANNSSLFGHIDASNRLVGWNTNAPATLWTVKKVTKEDCVQALNEVLEFYGSGLGQYAAKTDDATVAVENARNLLAEGNVDIVRLIEANNTLQTNLTDTIVVSLNKPQSGMFLRIRTAPEWKSESPYLTSELSTVSGKTTRAAFSTEKDEHTIFYLHGDLLVAYASGYYLKNNSSHGGYATSAADNTAEQALPVTFQTAVTNTLGSYNLSIPHSADKDIRLLYTNVSGNDYYMDAGDNITSTTANVNGYSFRLEEVTELPVKIVSEKGLATFWTPVALRVPETVDVYTLELGESGDVVVLTALEAGAVLPAQTGVLLAGNPDTYNFEIVKDNSDSPIGSLSGQVAYTTYSSEDVTYTLQNLASGKMGFKKYTGTTMGAFKSYLQTSAATASALSMVFADDATGIEGVQAETEKETVIYDLNGRRVTAPRKGVYIVNGVKVIIK
ncbi:MAG: hypothetical protein NC388_00350 [Clostridium sp.]|nr:hypothetical protein [Clostridium sp.]